MSGNAAQSANGRSLAVFSHARILVQRRRPEDARATRPLYICAIISPKLTSKPGNISAGTVWENA